MKNFLCGSLVLLLIYACSVSKRSAGPEQLSGIHSYPFFISDTFDKALYKATLDIKNQHLSGFLLIKKISDSVHRIVFANEIGMTMFDFGIQTNRFTVHYIFEPLNKKILVRLFEKNFRQLIFNDGPDNVNPFLRVQLQSEGQPDQVPDRITIVNPGIKMSMVLTLISQ